MIQSLQGIWRVRKGVCLKKYVYKPYHPWRHGYRRDKIHVRIICILRIILVIEMIILSIRYLEENTNISVIQREVPYEIGNEELFGIGFEPENGELFWFHKKTETKMNK